MNQAVCLCLTFTATCSQLAWRVAGFYCTGGALARSLLKDTTGAAVEKQTSRILHSLLAHTHTHTLSRVLDAAFKSHWQQMCMTVPVEASVWMFCGEKSSRLPDSKGCITLKTWKVAIVTCVCACACLCVHACVCLFIFLWVTEEHRGWIEDGCLYYVCSGKDFNFWNLILSPSLLYACASLYPTTGGMNAFASLFIHAVYSRRGGGTVVVVVCVLVFWLSRTVTLSSIPLFPFITYPFTDKATLWQSRGSAGGPGLVA